MADEASARRARPHVNPVDKVYRALGDPLRLKMIRLLRQAGELGCGDLTTALGISRPTLSYHTKVMQQADLIIVRKQGPYRYYALNENALRTYAPALLDSSTPLRKPQ